jgi:hypothetical protein
VRPTFDYHSGALDSQFFILPDWIFFLMNRGVDRGLEGSRRIAGLEGRFMVILFFY